MTAVKTLALSALALSLAAAGCSNNKSADQAPAQQAKPAVVVPGAPEVKALTEDDEVAVISTAQGRIVLRFFPEVAPEHVSNFINLSKSKFYDGTTFHRVIPGFMIQGGDPNSRDDNLADDGMGRGPRNLQAEFSRVRHERGILSMARGQNPNSASCQFFIMVAEAPHLDGQYSAFGKVVKGLDVVDRIVELPRNENDNPGKAARVESITIQRAGDVLKFPID